MLDVPFLTINEYSHLDDNDLLTELVRGQIVEHPFPTCLHGFVCAKVICTLAEYEIQSRFGRAVAFSGIITQRNPDTLRGADASFYSYKRMSRDADLNQYPVVPPEIIFEVKDRSDTWSDLAEKVAEYLYIGVDVVCVVDPEERVIVVNSADAAPQTLTVSQSLAFPKILPGFQVPIGDLLP